MKPPAAPRPPNPVPGPAELTLGEPVRDAAEERWCELVTVAFRNTGGRPVTAGTVRFGTHVIDSIGIDWSTVHSERALPVPIAPGDRRTRTWKLCLEEWRVPIGTHVETRGVSVDWR